MKGIPFMQTLLVSLKQYIFSLKTGTKTAPSSKQLGDSQGPENEIMVSKILEKQTLR